MNTKNYPRILVIGAAPLNPINATGITQTNLFNGWPLDRIAQIYDSDLEPSSDCCNIYVRFSARGGNLYGLIKKGVSFFRVNENNKKKSNIYAQKNRVRDNVVVYDAFSAYADILPYKIPRKIIAWVRNFQPDLIYSSLGNVRMIELVLKLAKIQAVPVVPHFLDDWPSTLYLGKAQMAIPRYVLRSRLNALMNLAPMGLTISDDMALEYEERYHKKFISFMNCVDISFKYQHRMDCAGCAIAFGFVGGLHLHRYQYLLDVVTALQRLKDVGASVEVSILVPIRDREMHVGVFSRYSVVKCFSTVRPEDVQDALSSFDVLIHVESFLKSDSLYTSLSISTKIPQYMAAGRPILAYGPCNLSSIKYISQARAGTAVCQEGGVADLMRAASDLISSEDMRNRLGRNGQRVARKNHAAKNVRQKFLEVMSRISTGSVD
ncbi:hypothetical protein [Castellaniella sp.]|uniref:hypothetical protein n=1 Tax=Castellaniella sp. TaxID=1955812 RepID=UPI003C76DCDA